MLSGIAYRGRLWLIMLLAIAALSGCGRAQQAVSEETVAPPKGAPPSLPQPKKETIAPGAPTLDQVQGAVARVFRDSVLIDVSRKPCFLVGDFNGDESQDLAVILRPGAGKLAELNREFPNWIAREPLARLLLTNSRALAPGSDAQRLPNPAAGQTVRFEQHDVLLAIIHGFGPEGWHHPQATQTHLMRDVVGTNLRVLHFKDAVAAYRGTSPFPTIYGDLIMETLMGHSGFLHYAGSIYDWYDQKHYSPKAGPGHPAMSMR